jgi:DoxX
MNFAAWTPRALSVLRIITGLLFLEHGTQKLLGFPPSEYAAPALFSLIGVQGLLELVGGFLILTGFSRALWHSSLRAIWRRLTSWPTRRRTSSRHSMEANSQSCSASCFSTWRSLAAANGALTSNWRARAHIDRI